MQSAGALAAVTNAGDAYRWAGAAGSERHGAGALVGTPIGSTAEWNEPGTAPPDGAYALARWDDDAIELLSDACASRTLWYAHGQQVFLAATSQRAIVALLGDFQADPSATAWLLTSGTLGAEASWDRRIRRLPPHSRLVLDRAAWRCTVHAKPLTFEEAEGDRVTHVARLRSAMEGTVAALAADADFGRWVLPLSGGRDSRTLLALFAKVGAPPRCLTWTTRSSTRNPLSDASIAQRLARHFGAKHELYLLDASPLDARATLDRFVAADEGRNDEIAGYVDGFGLWARLLERDVPAVIRGDEPFGMRARPATPDNARQQAGGQMAGDFPEGHLVRELGLAPQSWPERMRRRDAEDAQAYRSRLSQEGYIAITAAGLSGAKARYVEIVTPLLSRGVVAAVRSLPPALRQYARAFSTIVHENATGIPYARSSSTPGMSQLLASPGLVEELVRELTSQDVERVLPGDGARRTLVALAKAGAKHPTMTVKARGLIKEAVSALPVEVYYRVKPRWTGPSSLPPALLALRAVLALKTLRLLDGDAGALAATAGRTPQLRRERPA